jgi:hypothetical protein
MGHTVLAIGIGLILGLLVGGRARYLSDHDFRLWPLVLVGLALQVIDISGAAGFAILVVSYVCLVAFAVANLRLVGMGLVALGLTVNALVIVIDHGMPVRASAIVAAKVASNDRVHTLRFGAKHHLEKRGDHLMVLADIVPVPLPVSPGVLSFGDLVMDFGVADLILNLLRPGTKRRRRSDQAAPSSHRLRAWSVARAPASSNEDPAATPWRASPEPVSATTTTP